MLLCGYQRNIKKQRKMTCKECKWWNSCVDVTIKPTMVIKTLAEGETQTVIIGRCQRHSPVRYFPDTREDDWCGDFERKEGSFESGTT